MTLSTNTTTAPAATPITASETGSPAREHIFKEVPPYRPGIKRVPVERWFKQEYHDREVELIWKKAWQWACREDEIPEIGDYTIYEVGMLSFIVMRTGENNFKAYWNSCLHRGRKLCTFDGKRATELRCAFHGWAWDIEGKMTNMTCGFDFAGVGDDEVTRLREVRVGTWGGYVFINPDPDCESLESFLGEFPDHYAGHGIDMRKRWKQVHVTAYLDVNWKVVQEAFIEPWHVAETHPQLLSVPAAGKMRGVRWDDFGNWMRMVPTQPDDQFTPPPNYNQAAENEQQYLDHELDYHMNEDNPVKVVPGVNPALMLRDMMREELRKVVGDEADAINDMHLHAGGMVALWPNFHPWGGMSRLTYRFRPYRNDPNRSIMDIALMSPWPDDRPKPPPAKPHVLDFGDPITNAGELGWLAKIFAQDLGNIKEVHDGMQTSGTGYAILSNHHEAPVRRWHDQYERWMGIDPETGVLGEKS